MITDQHVCVRDAKALLIEVREALNGGANAALRVRIDEVVQQLSVIEADVRIDPKKIGDVLKLLGDGLALVPVIVELFQKLNR